jgi:nucleoside-diphosphate-sugar epimerase
MSSILVVGATGMTGKSLVGQLLTNGHHVRAIVRSSSGLPAEVVDHPNLSVIEASLLELTDSEIAQHVENSDAVVSCLGHNISFKGIFGEPRQLCTDATRRLCEAIETNAPKSPTKFVLMNTVGVGNPELVEKRGLLDRGLLTLLHYTLPPHRDNEMAAEYLRCTVGKENRHIEWCSVRPDSLINAEVSEYDIVESPITGIVTGRPTTRANVAHFMTELIDNTDLWATWKFRTPVIMDAKH